MKSSPFTLRQLEYFDAVARHGTLSAAADQCHVTASGLGLALDELERVLGVQLFIRRKAKGVTLTQLGAQLLSDARVLLASAGVLAAHASQDGTGIGGRLALGCYPTLSPFFLPGILEIFGNAHPALELEFVEAPAPLLHEYLMQGRIEAALLYGADISRELNYEPVHEYFPHALVAQSHPLASRSEVSLKDLVGESLIALDVPPSRQNTERIFSALGLVPRIGYSSMNFELVRCLVGRGLGYSVMFQRPAGSQTYDNHHVVPLVLSDVIPSTIVGLARPAGAQLTERAKALLGYLTAA